jgi:hypothetical protein
MAKNIYKIGKELFITSDEEIKEGVDQWYLDKVLNEPYNSGGAQYSSKQDVIILTTDQDLIKDGVQPIDDEFLEWFVKNPSCEEVETIYGLFNPMGRQVDPNNLGQNHSQCIWKYKIIIPNLEIWKDIPDFEGHYQVSNLGNIKSYNMENPKEEPKSKLTNQKYLDKMKTDGVTEEFLKQETLEEVADFNSLQYKRNDELDDLILGVSANSFMAGAKWQQEQDKKLYSEEDMKNFAWFLIENVGQYSCDRTAHFEGKYLEQFKKK